MPGSARVLRNFEPSIEGGYRRIEVMISTTVIYTSIWRTCCKGASQTGTSLNIANIRQTPEAGDTFKLVHALQK